MKLNIEIDNTSIENTVCLRVTGVVDVRNATSFQQTLSSLDMEAKRIVLDLNQVESIDASILQLIASFTRCSGNAVSIDVGPETPVARWIEISGLGSLLHISPDLPATTFVCPNAQSMPALSDLES